MRISLERLKEVMSYDPETGLWTRLLRLDGLEAGNVIRSKDASGYVQFIVDGKNYHSARTAWFYMTGNWPEGQVDHIDRNRTNDKWSNLRLATRSQNKANCGAYSSNMLGVKGVRFTSAMKNKPYRARIQVDGKLKHLGYFKTADEANAAYLVAAQKYFGEFAHAGRPE